MGIFEFFKKKKAGDEEKPAAIGQMADELDSAAGSGENISSDQGVTIHTMPKRFRNQHLKESNAKSAGLVIIGSGIIFLVAASALLYYFLFMNKSAEVIQQPGLPNSEIPTNQKVALPNTEQNQLNQPEEFPTSSNSPAGLNGPSGSTDQAVTSTGGLNTPLPAVEKETTTSSLTATSTSVTASTTETIDNAEATSTNVTAASDSDSDGLTDKEELLLGSDPNKTDSDGDGYNDLAEVLNSYDPTGPGKLIDNPNLGVYQNKTYKYSMIYPKSWSQIINGGEDSVMFKSDDNHFIQVIVEANSRKQKIQDWYQEQFGVDTIDQSSLIINKTWYGIKSADGMIIYLTDLNKNYIYTLTYNPGESPIIEYKNIFQAIINSFTITEGSG